MSRRTQFFLCLSNLAAITVLTLTTSSCSSGPPPNTESSSNKLPPTPTIEPATTFLPPPGIPKVDQPLDISEYLEKPCDVLNSQQITTFLGAPVDGKPDTDLTSGNRPNCKWARTDGSGASTLVILPASPTNGITKIYQSIYDFLLPLEPIEGYPVIAYGISDNRPRGECQIAIGIDNQKIVEVANGLGVENTGKQDPCIKSREIANSIILNVQGRK